MLDIHNELNSYTEDQLVSPDVDSVNDKVSNKSESEQFEIDNESRVSKNEMLFM